MSEPNEPILPGFEVVTNDFTPEIFAEGVSNSALGVPYSKIVFHTVIGVNADGMEIRKPIARLTIQTNSLLEFCRNTLAHAKENAGNLNIAFDHQKNFADAMLRDISVSIAPAVPQPGIKR